MRKGKGVFAFKGFKGFISPYRRKCMIAVLFLCALVLYGCEASVKVKWPKSDAFQEGTVVYREGRT